tara:strand:+ start:804 stop:947 length:144 start_codon:yes stop_codon:yes gene_type:complete
MTFEQFDKAVREAFEKAAAERGEELANLSCLFRNWRHEFSEEMKEAA